MIWPLAKSQYQWFPMLRWSRDYVARRCRILLTSPVARADGLLVFGSAASLIERLRSKQRYQRSKALCNRLVVVVSFGCDQHDDKNHNHNRYQKGQCLSTNKQPMKLDSTEDAFALVEQ